MAENFAGAPEVVDPEQTDGPARLATDHITTSSRDPEVLGARLQDWLATRLPAGSDPVVNEVVKPDGNGMSSETILFTAAWQSDDGPTTGRLVARIEPELDKMPLFPRYDLALQFRVMAIVAEASDVPVPVAPWFEADRDVIGAPFFVMERIDGDVPPDLLPYTFPDDNFVATATPEQRARMQRSAVTALAGIHQVTPSTHDLDFLIYEEPGETALERHLAHWEGYLEWASEEERSPLLDECFAWLRANLPTDQGEPRLSWGDSRIGNLLFADHEVVGVLDWEMAGIAPVEVDLGWMAYMHRFFDDIATDLGAEGLPDFMQVDDIVATYTEITGQPVGDLTWYLAYAAMRHGVIMRRVAERQVHYGEAERPVDPDDLIIHRATLRRMLDGSYA